MNHDRFRVGFAEEEGLIKPEVPKINITPGLTNAKRNLICFLSLLLFSSALVTSHHFHAAGGARADCAICKSADDFSAGGRQNTPFMMPEQIVEISPLAEQTDPVYSVVVAVRKDRGPPR